MREWSRVFVDFLRRGPRVSLLIFSCLLMIHRVHVMVPGKAQAIKPNQNVIKTIPGDSAQNLSPKNLSTSTQMSVSFNVSTSTPATTQSKPLETTTSTVSTKVKLTERDKQISQQTLLDCLTSGRWYAGKYTEEQENEIRAFLRKTRDNYKMPNPLQRNDSLCGSINFGPGLEWFRALCDPYESTPCCFNGTCQNRSIAECKCDNCYDLRQRIYAEYSTWKNEDSKCQVNSFTPEEACRVLNGTYVAFVGDSHMRHMYMGLQILLTGNHENGCMAPDLPEDSKRECRGLYMFTEKVCRLKILSTHSLCGGTVHLSFAGFYSARYTPQILEHISSYIGKPGSIVVIGNGHHDSFNPDVVIPQMATPVLQLLENSSQIWPKLVWVGVHSLGLLKTPTVQSHTNPQVLIFNKALRQFLTTKYVNFLNPFNLTKGVSSPDGSHYGKGANLLKARVLLAFLKGTGGVTSLASYIFNTTVVSR